MKGTSKGKIVSTVDNRAKRGMRNKIRGQLGTNTILTGNELLESVIQAANATTGARFYPLVAGSSEGRAVTLFSGVSRFFQKFLYESGTTLHYQPAVGLNAAGTIYAAFIDNPELVAAYYSGTTAQRLQLVKEVSNMKAYPVWQEFTFPLVATPRQKRFSNDAGVTYNNAENLNRVCQGLFAVAVEGLDKNDAEGATTKTIGQVFLTQRLRLEELSNYVN